MSFKIVRRNMPAQLQAGLPFLTILVIGSMILSPYYSLFMTVGLCFLVAALTLISLREFHVRDRCLWVKWQGRPMQKIFSLEEIVNTEVFHLGPSTKAKGHLVINTQKKRTHIIYFVDNLQDTLDQLKAQNQNTP